MYCKHCGTQIDDDSVFCNKCGKEQSTQPQNLPKVDKRKLCGKCGISNPTSNYTCENCGNSLTNAKVVQRTRMPSPPPAEKPVVARTTKRCQVCGMALPSDYEYPLCANCKLGVVPFPEKSTSNTNNTHYGESHAFLYVMSFIIPLVGYIAGAVFLSKDDECDKRTGRTCITTGIVSTILLSLTFFIIYQSLMSTVNSMF